MNFDKNHELLGHSILEIGNKIDFTYNTILPEDKESNGMINQYKWNSIQNLSTFEKAFGKDSEIYDFACQVGDKVTVLETKDVNGVLWGRVHNGWICMEYVD